MEEQSPPSKWEGEVSAETAAANPHEIWPLLADDFCSLHKWLPIDTCHHVEGVPGQPGLVRYCATTDKTSSTEPSIKWAHERLNLIDPTAHILTYEIRENNIGFKSYVATMKLLPGGDGGCKIVWSFVADPIEGWPLEEFVKYLDFSLQQMRWNSTYPSATDMNNHSQCKYPFTSTYPSSFLPSYMCPNGVMDYAKVSTNDSYYTMAYKV